MQSSPSVPFRASLYIVLGAPSSRRVSGLRISRFTGEPYSAPDTSSTTTPLATPLHLEQKARLIFVGPGDNGRSPAEDPMLQGILPTDTRVSEALLNILSEEGEPVVLDSEARVEMETIRCRS